MNKQTEADLPEEEVTGVDDSEGDAEGTDEGMSVEEVETLAIDKLREQGAIGGLIAAALVLLEKQYPDLVEKIASKATGILNLVMGFFKK